MLLLHVDDIFVIGTDGLITNTKRKLAAEFEMKDLGMMHYFLGMEVWQSIDGIFLGQGKYAVEILKRFGMRDCKSMATPMELNLKLLSDASSETVDATMYHPMIVLDVLDEHETRHFLCCEHLEPVLDRFEKCSLDCYKAYSEVLEGYN